MKIIIKKYIFVILALIFFLMVGMYIINVIEMVENVAKETVSMNYIKDKFAVSLKEKKDLAIVIDAGHGGHDPGKVGVNNILEKDINLEIAKKLAVSLHNSGFEVIMTRNEDYALHDETAINKKNSDLRNRVEIINKSDAILFVSIHQNSYITSDARGSQVFYYELSDDSKEVAKQIQDSLRECVDDGNKRIEKANNSYYLLKKTNIPSVIIECGFLSNYQEAELLIDKSYQDRIVSGITNGIIKWVNQYLEE